MDARDRLGRFLWWQVAAFSAGAAAIHYAEITSHFEEYRLFGVFFFAVAWFQAGSAIGIVTRPDRRLAGAIAVVNLVVIWVWIWSRTAGLPIGPEAGEPEVVGSADLLATVLEALVVTWVLAGRAPAIGSRSVSRRSGVASTAFVWLGVVAMTSVVFLSGGSAAIH
jgi:hypothetical protein